MIVFLDLWLTVRNPFFDRDKRVKYYWAYLIIQTILISAGLIYIDNFRKIEVKTKAEILALN